MTNIRGARFECNGLKGIEFLSFARKPKVNLDDDNASNVDNR
jgi:hypothetical protein